MLKQLAREDAPQYASRLIRSTQRLKLYTSAELFAEVLQPLVKAGLVTQTVINRCNKFQISQAGIDYLEKPQPVLQVVEPRTRPFVAWDGRQRWDVASVRGCHAGVSSFGVMC